LIFDLDGTVWDSAKWFACAIAGDDATAYAALRRELMGGGNIVGTLTRAKMTRTRLLREADRRCGPPPLFKGIAEALNTLAQRGTPLAVATSLPGSIAIPMLEAAGLGNTFDAVVHAGLCRTAKPNPASIHMALRMIKQAPSAAVFYVGDRATDAQAAKAAGIGAAWIRHGYEKPLRSPGIVVVRTAELVDL
jgi:HAD superfamily hydrolase (TIGR01509 family)